MKVRDVVRILKNHGFRQAIKGQPPTVRGSRPRDSGAWLRSPARGRRGGATDTRIHRASVRVVGPRPSAERESRGRGDVRFQQERACVALASAVETMVRGGDRQPRPDAPRRSPAQERPAFICRQLGDTFQIHVDAGLERRNDRRRRFAVYGDVEIGANGVPSLAASVGVALQGRHVDSAGRHATPIISRLTHSSRNGCASEGVIVSYDTRSTFISGRVKQVLRTARDAPVLLPDASILFGERPWPTA